MITQLQQVFSLLYQRKRKCRLTLIALRRKELSPEKAGKKIFKEEFGRRIVPDTHLLRFLLMVRQREWLALSVMTDLRKQKGRKGKMSVDEALEILKDEIEAT